MHLCPCMSPSHRDLWDSCGYIACPVFWTDFLQIASFILTGHGIIVINLTIIEFYYKSDICLWFWQGACLLVIIIASQPRLRCQTQMIVSTARLSMCVCVCRDCSRENKARRRKEEEACKVSRGHQWWMLTQSWVKSLSLVTTRWFLLIHLRRNTLISPVPLSHCLSWVIPIKHLILNCSKIPLSITIYVLHYLNICIVTKHHRQMKNRAKFSIHNSTKIIFSVLKLPISNCVQKAKLNHIYIMNY
jgi:hypothetical protein